MTAPTKDTKVNMTLEEIKITSDRQALVEILQQTENQLFAARNFKSGQMYVDAKLRQNAAMSRAEEILR